MLHRNALQPHDNRTELRYTVRLRFKSSLPCGPGRQLCGAGLWLEIDGGGDGSIAGMVHFPGLNGANRTVVRVTSHGDLHLIANGRCDSQQRLDLGFQRLAAVPVTAFPGLLLSGVFRVVAKPVAMQCVQLPVTPELVKVDHETSLQRTR